MTAIDTRWGQRHVTCKTAMFTPCQRLSRLGCNPACESTYYYGFPRICFDVSLSSYLYTTNDKYLFSNQLIAQVSNRPSRERFTEISYLLLACCYPCYHCPEAEVQGYGYVEHRCSVSLDKLRLKRGLYRQYKVTLFPYSTSTFSMQMFLPSISRHI